jgi:hypothetical protein
MSDGWQPEDTTIEEFIAASLDVDERERFAPAHVAAIRQVVALHQHEADLVIVYADEGERVYYGCSECAESWPCPTIRAVACIWRGSRYFDARWAGDALPVRGEGRR